MEENCTENTKECCGEHAKQTECAGISKTYAYHKPSPEGLAKITELRKLFSDADAMIQSLCPASRDRSIAITCLEDACMRAIKAVVINDPASVPENN